MNTMKRMPWRMMIVNYGLATDIENCGNQRALVLRSMSVFACISFYWDD